MNLNEKSFAKLVWTEQKQEGKLYTAAKNTYAKPTWFKYLMIFLAVKLITIIAVFASLATYGALREAKELKQRNAEISDSLHLYRAAYNYKKLQP